MGWVTSCADLHCCVQYSKESVFWVKRSDISLAHPHFLSITSLNIFDQLDWFQCAMPPAVQNQFKLVFSARDLVMLCFYQIPSTLAIIKMRRKHYGLGIIQH